jgi:Lipocalin-like domain
LCFTPGITIYTKRTSTDLSEELPKNGDVPMSPLSSIGGLGAIGGHNSNLKIDLSFAGAVGTADLRAQPRLRAHLRASQTARKENTMNRRTTLAITTTALLCFAVGSSASPSLAQQTSVKQQLVGTWTLVSSDQVRPDGSKLKQFGANPNGINVFDPTGRFFLMMASDGT